MRSVCAGILRKVKNRLTVAWRGKDETIFISSYVIAETMHNVCWRMVASLCYGSSLLTLIGFQSRGDVLVVVK